MGRRIGRSVVAGAIAWAGLTACSAGGVTPRSGEGSFTDLRAVRSLDVDPPGPPLAFLQRGHNSEDLALLDPRTLATRRKLSLGPRVLRATAFSPDARRLMTVTTKGHARVVDVQRLRDVARFSLGARISEVFWIEDEVALAAAAEGPGTAFLRFDPSTGEILGRHRVDGTPFDYEPVAGGVVALLYDQDTGSEPGATTVAVVGSDGEVDSVPIEEIRSGYFLPATDDLYRKLEPALAVRAGHATVVGVDGTIASVDLADGTVVIEDRSGSFFEQVAAWFVPPAHAKTLAATALEAEWIAPDTLLVAGYGMGAEQDGKHTVPAHPEPSGAVILDPADWSSRVVDEEATAATVAGDLLLASHKFVPGDDVGDGIGVRAYDGAGRLQWHALGTSFAQVVAVHRGKAVVRHGWFPKLSVVDLESGEVLAERGVTATFPPGIDRPI